jgi:hypothetical protein
VGKINTLQVNIVNTPFEVEVLYYRSDEQGSDKTRTLKLWIRTIVGGIVRELGK